MKKIFLFFSAVLVSLAMQATIQTQDINLSELSAYGTATVSGGSVTEAKEWHGAQRYYNDENAYALNREDYAYVCVELSSVATSTIRLQVEYTTADGTAAQSVDIPVGSKSKALCLTGTYIKTIEVLNWTENSGVSFTISKLYLYKQLGKKSTTSIYSGTHTAATDWDHSYENRLPISGDKFASIHDGDSLSITYTSNADASCNGHLASGLDLTEIDQSGNMGIASSQSTPTTVSIALHGSDVENLQANGIYFEGINYTLTDVSLITYEQQFMMETELAHGAQTLNWGETWKQTAFPTLAAGDELRVTVSAVDNSGNYQMYFKYGWGEEQQIAVTGIDANIPKFYSVTLTAEQASAINTAGQLFLYGTGVTLSRFAIAQPRSIYTALYHGEKAMDWDGLFFEASNFSGLTVGDRICANVSEIGDRGNYPKLIFSANYTEFTPSAQYDFSASHAAPMTVSYPVTAEMLSLIQTSGLRLRGEYCTVTEVYVQTAEPATVSYNLKVSSAGMATLVLPFSVSTLPAGVEAYTLVNNGDATIWATPVSSIEADKPVLIVAAQNEDPGYEFVNEIGGNGDITGKAGTYRNEALVGTYRLIKPLYGDDGEGGHYHYILQNGASGVGFYKVGAAECSIAPYRAYLSCSYDKANDNGGNAAPMRIVFHKDNTTDMESVQHSAISTQKILRNGQILIIRDGKTYDIFGQPVNQ